MNFKGGMWGSNPRMPEPRSGVLTKLHQYRHVITIVNYTTNYEYNNVLFKIN